MTPSRSSPKPETDPAGESLGEQLLREAREGQAEFAASWRRLMEEQHIEGAPIGAKELRALLAAQGVRPEDNAFSRDIAAQREE